MFGEVVQEKIPFARTPERFVGVAIESGREPGDPVELAAEIGQRFESFDLPGFSFDLEKIDKVAEEREAVDVESEAAVAKMLANEKEETAATTEIENFLRRHLIQFQVLDAFDVGFEPLLDAQVLRRVRGRIGIARLNLAQTFLVDLSEERWQRNRMELALKTTPGARMAFAAKKFPELVRNFHGIGIYRTTSTKDTKASQLGLIIRTVVTFVALV